MSASCTTTNFHGCDSRRWEPMRQPRIAFSISSKGTGSGERNGPGDVRTCARGSRAKPIVAHRRGCAEGPGEYVLYSSICDQSVRTTRSCRLRFTVRSVTSGLALWPVGSKFCLSSNTRLWSMVATRRVSSGGAGETTHSPSGPATHEPPSARTSAQASPTLFRHAEPAPISSRRINPETDRTYDRDSKSDEAGDVAGIAASARPDCDVQIFALCIQSCARERRPVFPAIQIRWHETREAVAFAIPRRHLQTTPGALRK